MGRTRKKDRQIILLKTRTVSELIAALEQFPKEMLVEIWYEGFARNWPAYVQITREYGDGPVVEIAVEEPPTQAMLDLMNDETT